MINLTLPSYCFTASLPEDFTITECSVSVEVQLYLDDVLIYSTTLQANNGTAHFYGFRSLMAEYMKGHHLVAGMLKINAIRGTATDVKTGSRIIYASFKPIGCTDEVYLASHFLTTRESFLVFRDAKLTVALLCLSSSDLYVDCRFLVDGVIDTTEIRYTLTTSVAKVFYLNLDAATVKAAVEYEEGMQQNGKLLSATLRCGNRSIAVYYTEDEPEASFRFRNAFNIMECIHIYAKDILVTDYDRKEAVCQGKATYYDETITHKHSLETCSLPPTEGRWFNEFLAANEIVFLPDPIVHTPDTTIVAENPDDEHIPAASSLFVILSDITSEVALTPDEQTKVKFSWRLTDNADILPVTPLPTQVFNNKFHPIFQ